MMDVPLTLLFAKKKRKKRNKIMATSVVMMCCWMRHVMVNWTRNHARCHCILTEVSYTLDDRWPWTGRRFVCVCVCYKIAIYACLWYTYMWSSHVQDMTQDYYFVTVQIIHLHCCFLLVRKEYIQGNNKIVHIYVLIVKDSRQDKNAIHTCI